MSELHPLALVQLVYDNQPGRLGDSPLTIFPLLAVATYS